MIWCAEPGKDRLYPPPPSPPPPSPPTLPCCRLALLMYWLALLMHGIMIMALRALMKRGWGLRVVWVCVSEEREGVAGDTGVGGGGGNSVWLDTNRPTYKGGMVVCSLSKDIMKQKCEEPAFDTSNLGQSCTSGFVSNDTVYAVSVSMSVSPHLCFNLCIIRAFAVVGGPVTQADNLICYETLSCTPPTCPCLLPHTV